MGNWEDGDRMNKKIKIQKVSSLSFVITIIVAVLFAGIAAMGRREFNELKSSTEEYIACENAAKQLLDGSDYLSEQTRLYAMTGQKKVHGAVFPGSTGSLGCAYGDRILFHASYGENIPDRSGNLAGRNPEYFPDSRR